MGAARLFAALPLLFMAACTGQVVVPPVTVDIRSAGAPIAGNYAAMVQSGGWDLQTKAAQGTCWNWTFNTDVNQSYSDAMKSALAASLQKVTFTPGALSPEQMQEQGYDTQVFIYQSNAAANFGVRTGFFSASAGSNMELTTLLAAANSTGWRRQQTVTGKGAGAQGSVFTCDQISPAIAGAAQAAITDTVKTTILYLRNDLLEHAAKTAATK